MFAFAALPSFLQQIGRGLGIFATVLAASLPLAFVSESLALAVAVGVGSVFLALLARRLKIALMIAALIAVVAAFGASHSIHLARSDALDARRFAALAPAAGVSASRPHATRAAFVSATRVSLIGPDGGRTALAPLAVWAFPAALFALWALGFSALALNRALLRWLRRRLT